MFIFITRAESAAQLIHGGIELCTRSVIPALFPFIVLSNFLVSSGAGAFAGRFIERPARFLFGISGAGAGAFLLGAVCGYPLGAKTAASLRELDEIDRDEFGRLICFCNNTGPAFVVGYIGVSLWGSARFGLGLYLIQILAAVMIGFIINLYRRISEKTKRSAHRGEMANGKRVNVNIIVGSKIENCGVKPGITVKKEAAALRISEVFAASVSDAAGSMVVICAYVLFFCALSGLMTELIFGGQDRFLPSVIFSGLFELTSGARAAAALAAIPAMRAAAAAVTAFLLGFSGISVHMQTAAVTRGAGVGMGRYLAAKLAQGLICAALMLCAVRFSDITAAANGMTTVVTGINTGVVTGVPVDIISIYPAGFAMVTNVIFYAAVMFKWVGVILISNKKR